MSQKINFDKTEAADFKYDNSFSKFQPKDTQTRYFWFQISEFLFLHQSLRLNKFESVISNITIIF